MEAWLSREHFDLMAPWEQVRFQVRSTFDVVGAPGWRIALERQPCYELWLVREGDVELQIGARREVLRAPTLGFLHAGETRDSRHIGGAAPSILGFSFDATLFGALDFVRPLQLPLAPDVPVERLEPLLERIVNESRARRPGYALAVHATAQLAFVELWRACGAPDGMGAAPSVHSASRWNGAAELEAALQLVQTRFDEPLSVGEMARATHLSPKHFGRKFHAALGLTPMEYVRKVRLGRARDLLASSDLSGGAVAARVGFASAAHFSRAFKTEFGLSPQAFRHSLRLLSGN